MYNSGLAFLLVCTLTVSALESATCGNSCVVNTDCGSSVSDVCGSCMNRVCGSGCGFSCANDDSCRDVNCPSCNPTTKKCGPSPTPTPSPSVQCGGSCEVDSHCSGECTLCFKFNNSTVGTCGQGCKAHCTLDSHCLDSNCNSCNTTTKTCAQKFPPTSKCGATCEVNSQCGGDCKICFKSSNTSSGICGEGCGATCAADSECVDPNCGVCNKTSNRCGPKPPTPPTPPGGCSATCTTDSGCSGECNLCFKKIGSTSGSCGVGCNGNCTVDAHCADSNCPSCNATTRKCGAKPKGFEAAAKCANNCVVDTDCQISGVKLCGLCMQRKCASGCGMSCDVSSHCGDTNCPFCDQTTKLCGPPPAPTPVPTHTGGCGAQCVVDTQCVGECDLCFKTANQTTGKCGVGCNTKCTTDAHCADDNCPVCDMETKRCSRNPAPTPTPTHTGGCGAQCVVDTQCVGECDLCFKTANQTTGKCGVGCNAKCTTNAHCADSNCPICNVTSRTCGRNPPHIPTPAPSHIGGCGSTCVVDTNCGGECDLCFKSVNQTNGKCGVGCNSPCTSDIHCADTNCPVCDQTKKTCTRKPITPTPSQ